MASLNLSVEHGQTWPVARANFESGITQASTQFARWIRTVEWSGDRTAARLTGDGFHVDLSVDDKKVHARGEVPFFFKMFEGQARKVIQSAISKALPKS